jgi:hypothetical protein
MLDGQGNAQDAGLAPYLDFRPLQPDENDAARKLLETDWLKDDIEKMAMHFAIAQLVPAHLKETRERRLAEVDRVEGEASARSTTGMAEPRNWHSRSRLARVAGSIPATRARTRKRSPNGWTGACASSSRSATSKLSRLR